MPRHLVQQLTRRRRPALPALALTLVVALATAARPAGAYELRLTTENDILVTDQDDLYTFALALQVERGPYTVALHENAFTDRAAGVRFDESRLTVGRQLAPRGPWSVHLEAGVVHVGRGLFGEDTQNAVHDLFDGDEVELAYVGSSVHVRGALTVESSWAVTGELDLGPRIEVVAMPGLHSHALLGAQVVWRPVRAIAVHAMVGPRFSDASNPALEPHLEPTSAVARVGILFDGRVAAEWSYNQYGDGREHISVGYRVAPRGNDDRNR